MNKISWDFLWDTLELIRLPRNFILQIQACITTPSFLISLNRGLHEFFKSSRGLQQGNPLSPYLFIIGMNVLSNIIIQETSSKKFKYYRRCSKTGLAHMCFTNNLFLFSNSDMQLKNI